MRPARRNRIPKLILVLGLTVFGFLAGLSNAPTSPVIDELVRWPLIGPMVGWVRSFYLPPAAVPPVEELPLEADEQWDSSLDNILVEPAGEGIAPSKLLWLLPGSRVHREPDTDSVVLIGVAGVGRGRMISRRGEWYEVVYRQHRGWVRLSGYDPEGDPPYGNEPTPPGPLEATSPDEKELAAALEIFAGRGREVPIGHYVLHTDLTDPQLMLVLEGVAERIATVYQTRYGRAPVGPTREQVVLYRSELSYRVVQQRWERLRGLPAVGHHTRGIAALFVGGRPRSEVAATLVHELVHALNTRAIGPALPPWLDEGLAEDLSYSKLGEDGSFGSQELAGQLVVEPKRTLFVGPFAGLKRLLEGPSRPDPMAVMELDWETFVHTDGRRANYSVAGFWIRYLVAADASRASRFRLFLGKVAAGESVAGDRLIAVLEEDERELRDGFWKWLQSLGKDSGLFDLPSS